MIFKFINLSNQRFGRWIVIKRGGKDSDGHIKWICKCDCGTIKEVTRSSLRNGRSKGCAKCSPRNNRHGLSRSPTYKVWDGMIQRCTNLNTSHYIHYGGRGITVCSEWKDNFTHFLNDMGEKPKNLTLDRIDNEKGYSKDNCRWTTMKVQNRNRRNCIKIGDIHFGWELIHRFDNPSKSQFQCIHCCLLIVYCTSSVKLGRKICQCQRKTPL